MLDLQTDRLHLTLRPKRGPTFTTPTADANAEALDGSAIRLVHDGGPLLEETDYVFFAQSRDGSAVAVHHRDPVLLRHLHASADGRAVHGVVNAGSQVGTSRFVIALGGRPHAALSVPVVPTKLDYPRDVAAIRADLERIAGSLSLAYLRSTTWPATPVAEAEAGGLALLTHLGDRIDRLEKALTHAAEHPLVGLAATTALVRSERVRRPDAHAARAVVRGAGAGAWVAGPVGAPVREWLPHARPAVTRDVPEHRWLAAALRDVHDRLARLRRAEASAPRTARRADALAVLDGLGGRLRRLHAHPLLAGLGHPPPEPPPRLLSAPGYREATQICLALRRGLDVGGGPLDVSLKDLHLLYEMWCYITVVRLAAQVVGSPVPLSRLVRVTRQGLRVRIAQGRRHRVRLPLPDGALTLIYNPRFSGRRYLAPQQPDVVLRVRRRGQPDRLHLLDAKYRLDASDGYVRRYGTAGPPVDALHTLHRYRDALRGRDGSRPVASAAALFPWREPEPGHFGRSRLYTLLEEIGIGALPLLPGADGYVQTWIERLIRPADTPARTPSR